MVALNFQPRFADDVESGRKTGTIRANARCKPGDRLQLYTCQRTKQCRKLADAICTRVRQIEIAETCILIDGNQYGGNDIAQADGFSGFMAMADWFRDRYGALPFSGFMIEWRPA